MVQTNKASTMPNNSCDNAVIRDIIRALDEAIAKGEWQTGLFFRVIGERLTDLRERLLSALEAKAEIAAEAERAAIPGALLTAGDDTAVFILLYQSRIIC